MPKADQLTVNDLTGDCFECKIAGTVGAFALGSYLVYCGQPGRFVGGRPHQLLIRSLAAGAFYISAARWFYMPPFRDIGQR